MAETDRDYIQEADEEQKPSSGRIPDEDIPCADPERVIIQVTPLIYKIARRYLPLLDNDKALEVDDLIQAGRIAVFKAQKTYDPTMGKAFVNYCFDRIRSAIRHTLGFKQDGTLPEKLERLDDPIGGEDDDLTLLDTISGPDLTPEEICVEEARTLEIRDAVREAVNRLQSEKQREVIQRVWLDGQSRGEAASEMGMEASALRQLDRAAREKLERDWRLREFAIPLFYVSVNRFNNTMTSAVEAAVLWREQRGYFTLDGGEDSTGTDDL